MDASPLGLRVLLGVCEEDGRYEALRSSRPSSCRTRLLHTAHDIVPNSKVPVRNFGCEVVPADIDIGSLLWQGVWAWFL